jgi:DNA-binding NarL/FixJ family response regulator
MEQQTGTFAVKKGLAQMLKGGVIMDVVTPEHAKIAEDAGASAVMALERVPADIRANGGVARMSDPDLILKIMDSVTIPVMAKCRIGHFVEAQILEAIGVDYIDESEVLTPADESNHILKHNFKVPFVCGCRNLGEALRRVGEGAAMIRTVVLSQYATPGYVLALLEAGSEGRAYLLKERVKDLDQLLAAIHAVAEGGSVMDPKVVEALVAENARAKDSPLNELTARERDVLREMAEGKNNAAIAESLFLTQRSVEKVIHSIFLKLGLTWETAVHKRVKAVILYLAESG